MEPQKQYKNNQNPNQGDIITCSKDCYFMINYNSLYLCTINPSTSPPPLCFSAAYPRMECRFELTQKEMGEIEKKAKEDNYIERILKDLKKAKKT